MCLAIPGELLTISGEDFLARTGRVSFGGTIREVSLILVPEAEIGQYLLVHAGFAIGVVDEQEAHKIFEYLDEIERLGREEDVAK